MPLLVMHLALIAALSGHALRPEKSPRKNHLRDRCIVYRSIP